MGMMLVIFPFLCLLELSFALIAWPFVKLVEILEPIYIEALEIPVIGEILTNVAHFGDQISKNIPEIIALLQATLETFDIFHIFS